MTLKAWKGPKHGPWGHLWNPWITIAQFEKIPDFRSQHLVSADGVWIGDLEDMMLERRQVVEGDVALGLFLKYGALRTVTSKVSVVKSIGPLLDCRVENGRLNLWFEAVRPWERAALPASERALPASARVHWCKGLSWGYTIASMARMADVSARPSIVSAESDPAIEWRGIPDDQGVELTSEQHRGKLGALEWVWGQTLFFGGKPNVQHRLCVRDPGEELREVYLKPATELVAKLLTGELE